MAYGDNQNLQARFTADVDRGVLILQDLADTENGFMSITNDAEAVVWWAYNKSAYAGSFHSIIYKDTEGRWDQLLTNEGDFVGFRPLQHSGDYELAIMEVGGDNHGPR